MTTKIIDDFVPTILYAFPDAQISWDNASESVTATCEYVQFKAVVTEYGSLRIWARVFVRGGWTRYTQYGPYSEATSMQDIVAGVLGSLLNSGGISDRDAARSEIERALNRL